MPRAESGRGWSGFRVAPLPIRLIACLLLATIASIAPGLVSAACLGGVGGATPLTAIDWLGSWRAEFSTPARLDIDAASRLAIADPGRGEVVIRDQQGRVLERLTGIGVPVAVAFAESGRLVVGDLRDGRVFTVAETGGDIREFGVGSGEFGRPVDLALDPVDGSVWVADGERHVVAQYTQAGQLLRTLGGFGSTEGLFDHPVALAVTTAALYVVDQNNSRIQVFDKDGGFSYCIDATLTEVAECNFFTSFVFGGCPEVRRFDAGIFVHGDRIFVVDSYLGAVYVMGSNGAVVSAIGALGDGRGQMRNPTDVVVDDHGRMFVVAAGNARVEMFGLDDYENPERFVPAQVTGRSAGVYDPQAGAPLELLVEVPGYRLDGLDAATVTLNDLSAAGSVDIVSAGDADGDAARDYLFRFSPAMVAMLGGGGQMPLALRGELDGRIFLGGTTVQMAGIPDADGDGIADADDECPGSGIGEPVGPSGCTVYQACVCPGDAAAARLADRSGRDAHRRGHGHRAYRQLRSARAQCVAREIRALVNAGALSRRDSWWMARNLRRAPDDCGSTE